MGKGLKFCFLFIICSLAIFNIASAKLSVGYDDNTLPSVKIVTELKDFLSLTDTPNSYVTFANQCVKVNAGENALTFGVCGGGSGGGNFTFTDFQASFDLNISAWEFSYNQSIPYDLFNYNQTPTTSSNWTGNSTAIWSRIGIGQVGIGTTTPAQTLTVSGTLNISNSSGYLGIYQDAEGHVAINTVTNLLDSFTVNDGMDLRHTAAQSDDHAFQIEFDAAGFGDAKAFFIDYITGALADENNEKVIFINLNQFLSTGGHVSGFEIVTTEGSAKVTGLEVGVQVGPIEQLSGTFGDMDSALNDSINVLASFISTTDNITIFAADDDTVTIGNSAKFEEIEFILGTVASGAGIKPVFYHSTGLNTWDEFSPGDGTNGMRDTGVIIWEDGDLTNWATNGTEFLIRINRTQNNINTPPVETKIQIAVANQYFWDKNAYVSIFNLSAENELYINGNPVSPWLYNQTTGGTFPFGNFSFTDFQDSFDLNISAWNLSNVLIYNYSNINGTFNYNQSTSYDLFNYNQSTPYDLFNYNQSAVTEITQWLYNQTLAGTVASYENLALTNQTNTFQETQVFTDGINISKFGYVSQIYIDADGNTIFT